MTGAGCPVTNRGLEIPGTGVRGWRGFLSHVNGSRTLLAVPSSSSAIQQTWMSWNVVVVPVRLSGVKPTDSNVNVAGSGITDSESLL